MSKLRADHLAHAVAWPEADPRSPFYITGPAIISFSGGRTSAFMLFRILCAHGGVLPSDVFVVFCNTGREMPATLDFVAECASRWGVQVIWLEYRRTLPTAAEAASWRAREITKTERKLERARSDKVRQKARIRLQALPMRAAPGRQWTEEVSHNSASRDGEPFEAMLAGQGMLPNPVMRFCTSELKVRTVARWAASKGIVRWASYIGLRADEANRVERGKKWEAKERSTRHHPLFDAGIEKVDVLRFWKQQPFDLRLAGPWEGNCDGCFMKGRASVLRMMQDHPERMGWWVDRERDALSRARTVKPEMALFRADRSSYGEMQLEAVNEPRIEFGWLDQELPCTSGGCGV